MNILVTGGAGFIGSTLVRYLLAPENLPEVENVVVLDAFTYAGHLENLGEVVANPRLRVIRGDITNAKTLGPLLSDHAIGGILHLAAETHVDRSIDDAAPFIHTNVEGTLRLLEAARRAWGKGSAHRFLHVSTDEVYGAREPGEAAATERTPYAPRSPYAASKAAGDHLALAFHHTYQLPVTVAQSSNNLGPRQFPEKLIPLIILNALEEKPLPIYGDGQQIRDWLHVDDHARGLLAAFFRGLPGETYLFGSGREITNLEIVGHLCRLLDERKPRASGSYADLITPVPDRPGHDRRYAIDAGKARGELGWSPTRTLEEGLAQTVDWYLAHLDWCRAVTAGKYGRERLGLG